MDTTQTPNRNRQRLARMTLAASVLGGGALGAAATIVGAGAQDTTTTTVASSDAETTDTRLDHVGWVDDVFAQLVTDGTLTQEQADATKAALEAARPERPHGGQVGDRLMNIDELATLLGVEASDLATQLREGATLADIAEANGVEVQAVVDQLVANATEAINDKVASGDLTQERADEMLAELPERIADRVENGRPDHGHGPHGRFGGRDATAEREADSDA